MMTISCVMVVPAGIPIVMGLLLKRVPWWAGLASYGSGLTIGVILLLMIKELSFTQEVFYVGGVSALIYFIPGFFIRHKKSYKKSLELFFGKLATPISLKGVGETKYSDLKSLKVTGWTSICIGILTMTLFLLNIDLRGRIINLSIGILVLSIGLPLVCCSNQKTKKIFAFPRRLGSSFSQFAYTGGVLPIHG